jgi:hypothetical protein
MCRIECLDTQKIKRKGEFIMENTMTQFVEVLRNNPDGAFDFIANNGHKFSKSELVDIAKELLYGIYYEAEFGLITEKDHDQILANAADELDERYKEE